MTIRTEYERFSNFAEITCLKTVSGSLPCKLVSRIRKRDMLRRCHAPFSKITLIGRRIVGQARHCCVDDVHPTPTTRSCFFFASCCVSCCVLLTFISFFYWVGLLNLVHVFVLLARHDSHKCRSYCFLRWDPSCMISLLNVHNLF